MILTTLLAVAAALCGHIAIATSASAQSLEDALRRAEEPRQNQRAVRPAPSSPRPPASAAPLSPPLAPPVGGTLGGTSDTVGVRSRRWGAIAAAMWKRRGIVQVAVGTAIKYESKNEAASAALRKCRDAGGRGCKVATTWSRGCGYVTTGRNRKGAGWVARATYAQTMRDCQRKGYRCKKAIGGCVN